MNQQNPYAAPNSDLTPKSQSGEKPTIEEALARGYDYKISEVIAEAWQKTEGIKLKILIAIIIYFACALPLSLANLLLPPVGTVLLILLNSIIFAGIFGMTLKHYRNQPVGIGQMFKYFSLLTPLILIGITSWILTVVGLILFVIPGIYLNIAYGLAIWILIDNPELSFWNALEASRKAITQHWFKFFFLTVILVLIGCIAAIPLGIGLFWAIPLYLLSMAIVYERIFGAR